MFISAFYGIIDPVVGEIRYSNTGHPHAFILPDGADFERLPASDSPLGMDEHPPVTGRRTWTSGKDLLVLFTDGVSDARNRTGERLGEDRILGAIRSNRDRPLEEILNHVFTVLDAHTGNVPRRDDLTIVIVRS
jgi:sigma-B regulation protein RsbU (phosphoserine phosphatase)